MDIFESATDNLLGEPEVCERCGKDFFDVENRGLCLACRTRHNDNRRKNYFIRYQKGKCGKCGKDPLPGKRTCKDCTEKNRRAGKKYRDSKRRQNDYSKS